MVNDLIGILMCSWQGLRVCLGIEILVKFIWWTDCGYWHTQFELRLFKVVYIVYMK